MKKAQALARWKATQADLPILPHMDVIPYKAKGSTYGACGIRIDGNPEFIDAVMSRLKDLIDGENHFTRLNLARSEVKTKLEIGGNVKHFDNTSAEAEVCYIRLHERGSDAKQVSAMFDRGKDQANLNMFD